MSHVALVDVHIKDLSCLQIAAHRLGLDFRKNQKTYKWFGSYVGDHPLPTGFEKNELGKCDHALSVRNNNKAYEIGIVKRRDGKPGYALLWDFWNGGYGLQEKVGDECKKLKQEYSLAVAEKKMRLQGFKVERIESKQTKRIRLVCKR